MTITDKVNDAIAAWAPTLIQVNHTIHATPELAFEEVEASALLASTLRSAGFSTEVGVYGLDTAIEATYGTGDFTAVLCAEYDALPGIGHACGHNVIATAALGAALALAAVADDLGIRVKLLGTPAEEHGGGKVLMLERGAWEDATISLMVHGSPGIDLSCGDYSSQAVDRLDVVFTGRASHAAAAPERGVNAADAATIALVAVGLLRQQLATTVRVNAIIAEAGEVTNIIPAHSRVSVEVRSFKLDELEDAKRRVLACFEAGAIASGCEWTWSRTEPRYANLVQEPLLAERWDAALAELGRPVMHYAGAAGGSTDMGNVSHAVPSIHPAIAIRGAMAAPHTVEFAALAGTPEADDTALAGAAALALTVVATVTDEAARADLLLRQSQREPGSTTRSQDGD